MATDVMSYWREWLSDSTRAQVEFMVNEFLASPSSEQTSQQKLFSDYVHDLSPSERKWVVEYLDKKFFDERDPRAKNKILQLKNAAKDPLAVPSQNMVWTSRVEIAQWLSASPRNIQMGFMSREIVNVFDDGFTRIPVQRLNEWQKRNARMEFLEHRRISYYYSESGMGGQYLGQLESAVMVDENNMEPRYWSDITLEEGGEHDVQLTFVNPSQGRRGSFGRTFHIAYRGWILNISERWRPGTFVPINVDTLRGNGWSILIAIGPWAQNDSEWRGYRVMLFLRVAGYQ